jgi:Flp pilus assembly protein TadG
MSIKGVTSFLFTFRRREDGAAAVEFSVLAIVFCLFLAGIVDLGHAWFMRQVVTNASREGARYGVTFQSDTNGVRKAPSTLSPSVRDYVLDTCLAHSSLPSDSNPSVDVEGSGYTTGTKGAPLEVTVSATKTWFMLSKFIPGMSDTITIKATTIMQCE